MRAMEDLRTSGPMSPQAAMPPLRGEKQLAMAADLGGTAAGAVAASGGGIDTKRKPKHGATFAMDTARWSKIAIAHPSIGAATEATTEAATGVAARVVAGRATGVVIGKVDMKKNSDTMTMISEMSGERQPKAEDKARHRDAALDRHGRLPVHPPGQDPARV